MDHDKNLHAVYKEVISNEFDCSSAARALTKCMQGETSRSKVAAASMQRTFVRMRAILFEKRRVRFRNEHKRMKNLPGAHRKRFLRQIRRRL